LFNETEVSAQSVSAAKGLLTPELVASIADTIDGLSHAEIADLIEAIRTKAELADQALSMQHIESAVKQEIAKNKKNSL